VEKETKMGYIDVPVDDDEPQYATGKEEDWFCHTCESNIKAFKLHVCWDDEESIIAILESYGKDRLDGAVGKGWFSQVAGDIINVIGKGE
jgi:hypothetical protein